MDTNTTVTMVTNTTVTMDTKITVTTVTNTTVTMDTTVTMVTDTTVTMVYCTLLLLHNCHLYNNIPPDATESPPIDFGRLWRLPADLGLTAGNSKSWSEERDESCEREWE